MPNVKQGDRIRMTGIMPNDPAPMEIGAEGTVEEVTTGAWGGQIMVDWDNGRSLILLPSDPFTVIRTGEGIRDQRDSV